MIKRLALGEHDWLSREQIGSSGGSSVISVSLNTKNLRTLLDGSEHWNEEVIAAADGKVALEPAERPLLPWISQPLCQSDGVWRH